MLSKSWGAPVSCAFLALLTAGSAKKRSEEHTSELQSRLHLVCRLLLEKKKKKKTPTANNSSLSNPHDRLTPRVTEVRHRIHTTATTQKTHRPQQQEPQIRS